MIKVSVYTGDINNMQNWLDQFSCKLKMLIKANYMAFVGDPDFTIITCKEGLKLYWLGYYQLSKEVSHYFSKNSRSLEEGIALLVKVDKVLSMLDKSYPNDDISTISLWKHFIKEDVSKKLASF